jgi:hypothetical protein
MRFVPALLVLMSLSIPVHADWDAAGEAREAAAAKAEADRQAAVNKKNEAALAREALRKEGIVTTGKSDDQVIKMFDTLQRQKKAAIEQSRAKSMNHMRKTLGAAANGKSDEEVTRLYAAHNLRQVETGRSQAVPHVKNATGKTMQELENMSQEEMDKLTDELAKKYGQ